MKNLLPVLRQLAALGLSAAAWLAGPPAARAQTCTGTDPAGNAAARGLYAEYYSGYYSDDQSYFINNTAKLTRIDTAANFPTSASFTGLVGAGVATAGATGNAEQFSARFRGSFYAPTSTRYTFYLRSDDAAEMWLDNEALAAPPLLAKAAVNNGGTHNDNTVQASVYLAAGFHNLLIAYGQSIDNSILTLSFSTDAISRRIVPGKLLCTSRQPLVPTALVYSPLQATVLNGTAGTSPVPTLTKNSADAGTPRYELVDAPAGVSINATTGALAVAAGTAAGNYSLSVRVTTTGTNVFPNIFTFSVVDNTSAACTGTDAGGGPASSGLYASYYPGYFNDDQSFFAATPPGLVRVDPQLNFAATGGWGNLVPPATGNNANPDAFSARYQGSLLVATAGTYTFSLTSDDASYLWLDAPARRPTPLSAEATVNNGGPHTARTVTASVTLAAGKHDLLVHFGEVSEDNVLVLQYSGPDTGNGLVVVPAAALCSSTTGPPLATVPAQAAARFAVQLSPNPAPAGGPVRLHLQQAVASAVQLTVSDLQGRVVAGQALPAATALELPLPLGALRAGVYLLRLTSAAGTATQKLVLE